MTYDSETCAGKTVRAQVKIPQLLRYGCFQMMFKTYGSGCWVNLGTDIRRLQHYRPKNGQWVRIKRTLYENANNVFLFAEVDILLWLLFINYSLINVTNVATNILNLKKIRKTRN